MIVSKLASAVFNEVVSGLSGVTATISIPMQQLEDEIVLARLQIIHQYALKNLLPTKDLYDSLNCIKTDCKSLDKCCECSNDELIAHFEIPQIATVAGDEAIQYLGSTDKQVKFKVYTSPIFKYHKYKTRGKNKPYVYIDPTPNENNMLDGYIFNAPFLERLSVIAIFKDPRQVEQLQCCGYSEMDNLSDISLETKDIVVKKYIQYYRQLINPPYPNVQTPGGVILGAK